MFEKLKSFLTDDAFFMAVLVVLVSVVSFGLGRQSVMGESALRSSSEGPARVILTDAPNDQEKPKNSAISTENKVVGSRSGTKYHFPNCPGATQIKEENKVYFDSPELAKAAGYSPAANCPGLQ